MRQFSQTKPNGFTPGQNGDEIELPNGDIYRMEYGAWAKVGTLDRSTGLEALAAILEKTALVGPKGDKGDKGDQGEQGKQGERGERGLAGRDGKDGEQGLQGIPGRDGLNGLNGKDGRNGIDGRDGKDGIDGKDGLSAYEVAVQNGYKGDVKEWLASLKGKDGVDGRTYAGGGLTNYNRLLGGPEDPTVQDGRVGEHWVNHTSAEMFYKNDSEAWISLGVIGAGGGGGGAVDSVNGQTGVVVLTKSDVGLGNVDNTSDANKPISTATQTALDNKQPLSTVLTNTTASFTTAQETKLAGIADGAEVNVNADWNAVSGDAQILNKPTIPTQYTDEMAQDAVGAMIDSSLNYVDGTPLLQRAALTGEATASAGSNSVTLTNSAVIGKVLTGFTSSAGTVAATDTILQAFQKVVGNISSLVTGVSSVFGRTGAVTAQSGDYTTAQVTESGNLYFTDERAQDAVGAMVDSSLTYVDATPLLQRAALTGDVTASTGSNATTIANSAVTNAKMANMAASTIKGNNTGGAAAPSDLTASQVKTLLAIANTDVSGLGTMSTQNASVVAITGGSATLSNTGLALRDTDASHTLGIVPGSNLTDNRTLTLTTGDASRTLTMSGDATISGTNTGDQAITLTGDVTGSGTGSFAATIANDAVTYAKIQNVTDARLLGRSAGSAGDCQEITVGTGLSLSGGSLTASAVNEDWCRLSADYTLTSTTSAQKLFNASTNGALTLATGTYFFECFLYLTTMSGTSGNAAFSIKGGGTATIGKIGYQTTGKDSSTPLADNTYSGVASVTDTSANPMLVVSTGSGLNVLINGTFAVTGSGTIIPSIALNTAAAAVVKAGSYFSCKRVGSDAVDTSGSWS